MRAVTQRVARGSVSVDGQVAGRVALGLVILLGVGPGDTVEDARDLAAKIAHLRIFCDEEGRINRSVMDVQGGALVISQFTLYADTSRGRRPGFSQAALPEVAEPLVQRFAEELRAFGLPVETGVFGGEMLVEIHNDGPVTIVVSTDEWPTSIRR